MSEELNTNPTGHELYATVDEAAEVIKSGITAEKVAKYDGYEESLGTKVVANDSTATASESLSVLTVAGTSYSVGGSDNAWTADNLQFTFDEEAGTVSITVVKSDGTTESGTVSTTE